MGVATGAGGAIDNESYFAKADRALRALFQAARERNELHFALSLGVEFRGAQDAGWNTAEDAQHAYAEFTELLNEMRPSPIKVRVALAFYSHLAEAAGYYEVPKNMLRVSGGDLYNTRPFADLVTKSATGAIVAPNANRVFQNLAGHAKDRGHVELMEVFRDAFDADIRNASAHADYVLWEDGVRLRKRNGGQPRVVSYDEFEARLNRAMGLFHSIRCVAADCVRTYEPKRRVEGRLADEPLGYWDIEYEAATNKYAITSPGFVPGAS